MQFRRYRRLYGKGTLHSHYEALMDKTIVLADLLYHQPAPTSGTAGEQFREDPRTNLKNHPADGEIISGECGQNAGTNPLSGCSRGSVARAVRGKHVS